jgi:hypothetical protein
MLKFLQIIYLFEKEAPFSLDSDYIFTHFNSTETVNF